MTRVPIYHEETDELLGFIDKSTAGWAAQTLFGYVFARSDNKNAVEDAVQREGLSILKGLWQYFDKHDNHWYPCLLKDIYENRVVIIRTNEMGFQSPDTYKMVTILNPTETNLVKG